MSFLFKDEVLAKLLIESGVFEKLNKFGQQVSNDAKSIARKLADTLLQQSVQESFATPELQIYAQNLVSLDHFLTFLYDNKDRDDGDLIVYHNAVVGQDIPPEKVELYTKYKEFFVLKKGLIKRLHELNAASSEAGNELMKPLLQKLIPEANEKLALGFEAQQAGAVSNQQGESQVGKGTTPTTTTGDSAVNPAASDPNYKRVSVQNESEEEKPDQLGNSLKNLMSNLPFQSTDTISPDDMESFIDGLFTISAMLNNEYFQNERFKSDVLKYHLAMSNDMASWVSFINKVAQQIPASNATSYKTQVPFDLGGRPITELEQIFGSTPNARSAAQILLKMILLMQQSLYTIKRSPQLVDRLSQEVIDNQLQRSKAFADQLGPFQGNHA
jgi:hypothetical protein